MVEVVVVVVEVVVVVVIVVLPLHRLPVLVVVSHNLLVCNLPRLKAR